MFARRAAVIFAVGCLLSGCPHEGPASAAADGCVHDPQNGAGRRQPTGLITVRNNLDRSVRYTVEAPAGTGTELRTLPPGAVDRFEDRMTMRITFQRGPDTVERRLLPGEHYAFSNSTKDQPELYLQAHSRAVADLAPFVPTPMKVVAKMLQLAAVTSADTVIDIGCGDGRIVIAAAKDYGARGVGIDLDPSLIVKSEENATQAGVADRVEFRREDATKADLSAATVVTMYLLPHGTLIITPVLEAQLKPGTRVVCHGFPIHEWQDRLIEAAEVRGEDGKLHKVFLYRK